MQNSDRDSFLSFKFNIIYNYKYTYKSISVRVCHNRDETYFGRVHSHKMYSY